MPTTRSFTPTAIIWERLVRELLNIYDAHHVCVTAAQSLAAATGLVGVVILKSSNSAHYDAWICQPDRETDQIRWQDQSGWLTQILTDPTPRVVDQSLLAGSRLAERVEQALWLAPFRHSPHGHTPAGAIGLIDPPPAAGFDLVGGGIDLAFLASVGELVTSVLERAVLRYRATQQAIVSDVVNDITISLTSTLSLEDIFDKIANPVRRILNVDSVSIGLRDAGSGDLVFVEELLGPFYVGLPAIRVKAGQGIAGWVAEHREPLLVNDVYNDPRFYRGPDQTSGYITQSILCVPLMIEQQVIGVLEAINKQIGVFDDADMQLMLAIASPLAIALENARLHSAVLAEKRRIEAIFINMSEGMLTIDADGVITSANDSLLALLKADLADLIGQPARAVIHALQHDFSAFVAGVLAAEDETPNLACEVYTTVPTDAAPVLVSGAPVHDEHGTLREAVLVFSDLSQVREVERMRDDFFHNIVHELRTPLATILMYARLLKKGHASSEKTQRFLATIEHESDRLQTMVRQMLALAKMDARAIQRSAGLVELNPLLDELLPPLLDSAREKGIHVALDIDPELPALIGDREILYSVFKNLIENAIKFTPHGTVQVAVHADAYTLTAQISDQGIGIPQEALPNLFRRFYRTQTAVEQGIAGTGLGLYVVKEGVQKHRGTIEVASEIGEGTTFTIRLPLGD